MSFVAAFYVIDDDQSDEIASLAECILDPGKLFGLIPRKVIDTKERFWEFINVKSNKLEEYEYSGFAFVDLLQMYPALSEIGESGLGGRISKAMMSMYLSFTCQEAKISIHALGSKCPPHKQISQYFVCDGRGDKTDQWVVPIQSAWHLMNRWLSQVGQGKVGLLSVG